MGRRRKGRDISGWLVVDKPAGPSSTAVVNKVRWALGAAKAGHAGTLDPAATGVLAVALGEATKTVPYITDALKCYRFEVRWGAATNTDDAEGEVIAEAASRPEREAIEAALAGFRGQISQVPPKFSAVKIDGQRAYALAREGDDPVLEARPLWVESLEMVEQSGPDSAVFQMVCGKGGYVRAIARDLGQALGCLGHVAWLRRIWSGPFDASEGVDLETVEAEAKSPDLDQRLMPVQAGLVDLPEMACGADAAIKLRNGNPAPVFGHAEYGSPVWASHEGVPVAVGVYRAGSLHPSRVFNL
ncbi:MAG: tRNA pseudouridine(55) synthase TruB [Mangrovicoccus sp.]|nr:tRNA pseudouridine(55) synthase TruB [Mangrovicoccus sp.]